MFVRDASDKRVVIIIDFQHMAYNVAFGGAVSLSHTLLIDGKPQVVDTTIPALTIKTIHRWANKGLNPTAVCFDTKGSGRFRTAYFKNKGAHFQGESVDYKDSRTNSGKEALFTGINITANFLHRGGVPVFKSDGFEADDLVYACVVAAKRQYPTLPIHVITGDTDLVPLVDDQVSVFLRSRVTTYSVEKEHEKAKYVQITPDNYESVMSNVSAFKTSKLYVPYNTVLLAKILRGDSTDKLPGKADWKPKMYNSLLTMLQDDGHDIGNMFRYGVPKRNYYYRSNKELVPKDLIQSTPACDMVVKFSEPQELTDMCDILSRYVEQEDIDYIRYKYEGMNLNGAFSSLDCGEDRFPSSLKTPITGYKAGLLQQAVLGLQINLPQ